METLRRKSSSQTILVELRQDEWDLLADREHRRIALNRALSEVGDKPIESLQRVARALSLAASLEMVSIRLVAEESDALYLVARDGIPSRDVRELAFHPFTIAKQRSVFSLGVHHTEAHALGLRYLSGEWLAHEATVLGSLTIGCRTDRRPSPTERSLIQEVAAKLAPALIDIDRSEPKLRRLSLATARSAILDPPDVPGAPLETLRPREATVLQLYAEGRSVDEVAGALVISPHTVRTHIKLAFRRLGIHSRAEAAELVRANQLTGLL